MVKRGENQLKELERRLSQLKEEVGEIEEDSSEEEGEIPVIPVRYLANKEPYVCGVAECKQLFHTYNELIMHAVSHPNTALCRACLNGLRNSHYAEQSTVDSRRKVPLSRS